MSSLDELNTKAAHAIRDCIDTLSAIAKKYYGNASKYMVIFEANQPMLSHSGKIYPGQKLRIPAQ